MMYQEASIPEGRILRENEVCTVTAGCASVDSVPTLVAEGIRPAHSCTHAHTYVDTVTHTNT